MKKGLLVFLVLLLPSVYGLGIASPYLYNNTLEIPVNGSKIYTVTLQNPEDYNLSVKFLMSSEIASIVEAKEFYVLKGNSYDNKVEINITPPANARLASEYVVAYSIEPYSQGLGMIPMKAKLNNHLRIKIVAPSEDYAEPFQWDPSFFINALFVIVVLLVLRLVVFKKNV